jgi:hypothetical protein
MDPFPEVHPMIRRRAVAPLALALSISLVAHRADAAWPHDPTDNVPVIVAALSQTAPVGVSDGAGGMIVTWTDSRTGVSDIYAQRISATGELLWNPLGVVICDATGAQTLPVISADGSGGAVLAWVDARAGAGTNDVYAQKINASGAVQWTANGVAVCTATGAAIAPQVISDGGGGAIVGWEDQRAGTASNIYARRVLVGGTAAWTADGNLVCGATGRQEAMRMTTDNANGVILVWADGRVTGTDIYVQRTNSAGSNLWTADGVAVCTQATTQGLPSITADGLGGAIMCWYDNRVTTDPNIYAAKVTSTGTLPWTSQGVLACNATGSQGESTIISTTGAGAILAWRDNRDGNLDIYAQRFSSTGVRQWGVAGVLTHAHTAGTQINPRLCSDGGLGAYMVYDDIGDLFLQRLSSTGARMYVNDYTPVSEAAGYQGAGAIVLSTNGVLVAWDDQRGSSPSDIYAQRMEQNGLVGDPEPLVLSVRDIPSDQGGQVRVRWLGSYRDLEPYGEIESYLVDRGDGAAWTLVATVPAAGLDEYAVVAATLSDSTPGSPAYTRFRVRSVPRVGVPWPAWTSAPDSGCSVDNLSPAPPGALSGRVEDGRVLLAWAAGAESDLSAYRVYRGDSPDSPLSEASLVLETKATSFDEPETAEGCYRVTAVDRHGNESSASSLVLHTTGVSPAGGARLFLSNAWPSPSHAAAGTALRFGLERRANASLAIYDPAGRRVRVLASGERDPGEHTVRWDGRDESGWPASPGLYFVHFVTPGFAATRRLVLVP